MRIEHERLLDLIGELGRQARNLLDNCETSGLLGEEFHNIDNHDLQALTDVLDAVDDLPYEREGCILGPGARLQEALKQAVLAELEDLRAEREILKAALQPFADFGNLSGVRQLPDEYRMTPGSPMAAHQVTAGEFKRAAAAVNAASEASLTDRPAAASETHVLQLQAALKTLMNRSAYPIPEQVERLVATGTPLSERRMLIRCIEFILSRCKFHSSAAQDLKYQLVAQRQMALAEEKLDGRKT